MFRENFNPSLPRPQESQEQIKQPSKIKISSNIDFHDTFHNNMPALGANFDFSRSIDFCGKNSRQDSFYSQWEIDADDFEERKILEDLKGSNKASKFASGFDQEFSYPRQKFELSFHPGTQKTFGRNKQFSQGEQLEAQRTYSEYDEFNKQEKAAIRQKTISEQFNGDTIEAIEVRNVQRKEQTPLCSKDAPLNEKSEKLFVNTNRSFNKTVESEIIQFPLSGKGSPLGLNRKDSNREFSKDQRLEYKEHQQNTHPQNREEGGMKEVFKKYEKNPEKIIEEQENPGSLNDLSKSGLVILKRKFREKFDVTTNVQFNVIVVGASGLGKSTFIDAFLNNRYHVTPIIMSSTEEIVEKQGIKMSDQISFKINLIDTPGYGVTKNPEQWYSSIKNYIEKKFVEYKSEKTKIKKQKANKEVLEDKRVHAILYFLSGPRINDCDFVYMKKLQKYGNLIPVIAKGDSYSKEEILEVKRRFFLKASQNGIEFFNFHEALQDDPYKLNELMNGRLGSCPPFVIISSLKKIEISPGKFIYGREFPWGLCNIENPQHSDFMLLRTMLGGHICQEAIEQTNYYYKNYLGKLKEKQKKKQEKTETTKKIGFGAMVVVGLVGAFFAAEKKILR